MTALDEATAYSSRDWLADNRVSLPPNEVGLIWFDLETTGLDPSVDEILEVGAFATNGCLKPVEGAIPATFHSYVRLPRMPTDDAEVGEWLTETMHLPEEVREMHQNSGLLDALLSHGQSLPRADMVDCRLRQWLVDLAAEHKFRRFHLSGSSIAFDRKFANQDLFRFDELLHYRMIDVSSFALACEWLLGYDIARPAHKSFHRALLDAMRSWSIACQFADVLSHASVEGIKAGHTDDQARTATGLWV